VFLTVEVASARYGAIDLSQDETTGRVWPILSTALAQFERERHGT